MGILIKKTDAKPIKIIGTDVLLDSVYARVNYKAYPDGVTLEIGVDMYYSKEKYAEGIKIFVDVPDNNFFSRIDILTESQCLESAHTYAIQRFESLGYICEYL